MARKPKSDSPKKAVRKFAIPPKGEKCEKFLRPEGAFHKKSFRWVETPDRGKGKAFVMVACPKGARTRNMPRGQRRETRWDPKAPLGEQCTFVSSGKKAGLTAHAVVQRRSGGSCRTGYSKK